MYDVFATYRTPSDAAAFDSHYEHVHVPLVEKMPLLEEFAWGKVEDEGSETYLVARMTFQSAAEAENPSAHRTGRPQQRTCRILHGPNFNCCVYPARSRPGSRHDTRSVRLAPAGTGCAFAQHSPVPAGNRSTAGDTEGRAGV
ncbi:EthD family reductase [Pseudarthrobacter sp. ATCC 49987]|uniref:EthD family reductase n=1 Tax=Pseudarthrobacter sp. ATCC 49987 TaxID=2698204 RepID=UPI0019217F87